MRDYLFVSQMPKSYCRVFIGGVAHAIELAAKYSGKTEYEYMQMHYVFGSIKVPGEVSFCGLLKH